MSSISLFSTLTNQTEQRHGVHQAIKNVFCCNRWIFQYHLRPLFPYFGLFTAVNSNKCSLTKFLTSAFKRKWTSRNLWPQDGVLTCDHRTSRSFVSQASSGNWQSQRGRSLHTRTASTTCTSTMLRQLATSIASFEACIIRSNKRQERVAFDKLWDHMLPWSQGAVPRAEMLAKNLTELQK